MDRMDPSAVRRELARGPLGPGWSLCTEVEGLALSEQLRREVGPGHTLSGRSCLAVAKRGACEEVLFVGCDGPPLLASVRLTWRVPRALGTFPWVRVYDSVGAWRQAG